MKYFFKRNSCTFKISWHVEGKKFARPFLIKATMPADIWAAVRLPQKKIKNKYKSLGDLGSSSLPNHVDLLSLRPCPRWIAATSHQWWPSAGLCSGISPGLAASDRPPLRQGRNHSGSITQTAASSGSDAGIHQMPEQPQVTAAGVQPTNSFLAQK